MTIFETRFATFEEQFNLKLPSFLKQFITQYGGYRPKAFLFGTGYMVSNFLPLRSDFNASIEQLLPAVRDLEGEIGRLDLIPFAIDPTGRPFYVSIAKWDYKTVYYDRIGMGHHYTLTKIYYPNDSEKKIFDFNKFIQHLAYPCEWQLKDYLPYFNAKLLSEFKTLHLVEAPQSKSRLMYTNDTWHLPVNISCQFQMAQLIDISVFSKQYLRCKHLYIHKMAQKLVHNLDRFIMHVFIYAQNDADKTAYLLGHKTLSVDQCEQSIRKIQQIWNWEWQNSVPVLKLLRYLSRIYKSAWVLETESLVVFSTEDEYWAFHTVSADNE